MASKLVETFKDTAALVTDIIMNPAENVLETYKMYREQGDNPITALAWTAGMQSYIHGPSQGIAVASYTLTPSLTAVGLLSFGAILLSGNCASAEMREYGRIRPLLPRTAARNARTFTA